MAAQSSAHQKHVRGGYFVKSCPACMKFIEQYEKHRPWKWEWIPQDKRIGRTMSSSDKSAAFHANGPGPYDAGYLDRRFKSASLKRAAEANRKKRTGDYCFVCQRMTMHILNMPHVGRLWKCGHCGHEESIRTGYAK